MDETWIHHFPLKSNQLSAEWTAAGESRPKRPKTQTSIGKVLASIFLDAQSILFIDNYQQRILYSINGTFKEEIAKNGHK